MKIDAVRAYPRYKVDMRVLLSGRPRAAAGVVWVNVRSLGEGGMGADVPLSLEKDETLLADLVLRERVLSLVCAVRYHAGPLHGFEFIDITEEQRTMIRNYCQAIAS